MPKVATLQGDGLKAVVKFVVLFGSGAVAARAAAAALTAVGICQQVTVSTPQSTAVRVVASITNILLSVGSPPTTSRRKYLHSHKQGKHDFARNTYIHSKYLRKF